jgi:hypothetical protein
MTESTPIHPPPPHANISQIETPEMFFITLLWFVIAHWFTDCSSSLEQLLISTSLVHNLNNETLENIDILLLSDATNLIPPEVCGRRANG